MSLAEVLVALAVLEVAVVSVAVVVPISAYGVQEGQQLSAATFLAEQTMERVRQAPWSDAPAIDCLGLSVGDTAPVPTGASCHGHTSTRFPDEGAIAGHPPYRRQVRVFSCDPTPCAGTASAAMRRVEVTVTYTPLTAAGVSPSPKAVRLDWLVARR